MARLKKRKPLWTTPKEFEEFKKKNSIQTKKFLKELENAYKATKNSKLHFGACVANPI